MISPTVGRIVLVRFRDMDSLPAAFKAIDLDQPFAGTIAYVFSDRCVNLSVADHDGATRPLTSVRLLQDDDALNGEGYYAEWMPFQKGQATNLAGAADGIAAKVEQHIADAKASIETHASEIVEEIKRYFATPKAETVEEKQAKLAAIRERGIVERPDGTGYDIAPASPADPAPAPTPVIEESNNAPTITAETHTEQAPPQTTEPAPHG